MFTFRFKPLISLSIIVSLFVAQFSHIPHVHVGASHEEQSEHSLRPHVHIGYSTKTKHSHSHAHGHHHSHYQSHHQSYLSSKIVASKIKNAQLKRNLVKSDQTKNAKCTSMKSAFDVEHDQDAIYLSKLYSDYTIRSCMGVELNHTIGFAFACVRPIIDNRKPSENFYRRHLPDKNQDCPIYLLTLSIRC